MIVTARQIEELYKSAGGSGSVVLPFRARLTPLANDFLRAKKIELRYADEKTGEKSAGGPAGSSGAGAPVGQPDEKGAYIWWSDSPSGPAKAAIAAEQRQFSLSALAVANDEANLIKAIRTIAAEIKVGKSAGAVLLVKSSARAALFANRCPGIRAMVGTCMETVEQGVNQIAANVLIIEHSAKTLVQIRNLLARFLHRAAKPSPELEQQLKEMASCG